MGIDQWNNFFVMVGGVAAALAGLVFIAMSINLSIITRDATHKNRAIATMTGFTAVFMICAFALIGSQNYRWIGVEWLVISLVPTISGCTCGLEKWAKVRWGSASSASSRAELVM